MRLYTLLALASLPLLGACQFLGSQQTPPSMQRVTWEDRAPDCREEGCSLVNVDTVQFAEQPRLNALIEQNLLEMSGAGDEGAPSSLRDYGRMQLQQTPRGEEIWLQAKLIDHHNDLLVVELSSYLYRGGAHGMPGRGFINYSQDRQRALQLADLVQPGQEEAFWAAASEAHQRWLREHELNEDEAFRKLWPFQPTRNIALLEDKVLLRYDVYTLAPYAMGHPSLEIPYRRLRQILKAEYLPSKGR